MSEIRKDPITGRSVIVASERTERPREFDRGDWTRLGRDVCPFCAGHEEATPDAIATLRAEDAENQAPWSVRIVPNKYPALSTDERLLEDSHPLFEKTNGVGAHEVVIEAPSHVVALGELSEAHVATVVRAWGERLRDLRDDQRLDYALIFKNHGAEAGATLEHAHSQLIAVPFVPTSIREELEGARDHHEREGRCVFCRIGESVLDGEQRLVASNDDVLAYTPYAPRFPFEMRVAPREHRTCFEKDAASMGDAVADVLRRVLGKLDRALDRPPYNLVLHTAPLDAGELEYYHWHIEIIPALSFIAGFEWGTGCHVNPTPPERAAEHLRRVRLESGRNDE